LTLAAAETLIGSVMSARFPRVGASNQQAKKDQQNVTLHRMLAKTEMCKWYLQGKPCAFHKSRGGCIYAHGPHELRQAPELKKVSLCWAWSKFGHCTKGSACTFAHGEEDRQLPVVKLAKATWPQAPQDAVDYSTDGAGGTTGEDTEGESVASCSTDQLDHPFVAEALQSAAPRRHVSADERHILNLLAEYLFCFDSDVVQAIHSQFVLH